MLEFDDECIEVKIKEQVYKVYIPNQAQSKSYTKNLKKCSTDEEKEEALVVFLEELGLPRDMFLKLNSKQVQKLLEALHDQEKN